MARIDEIQQRFQTMMKGSSEPAPETDGPAIEADVTPTESETRTHDTDIESVEAEYLDQEADVQPMDSDAPDTAPDDDDAKAGGEEEDPEPEPAVAPTPEPTEGEVQVEPIEAPIVAPRKPKTQRALLKFEMPRFKALRLPKAPLPRISFSHVATPTRRQWGIIATLFIAVSAVGGVALYANDAAHDAPPQYPSGFEYETSFLQPHFLDAKALNNWTSISPDVQFEDISILVDGQAWTKTITHDRSQPGTVEAGDSITLYGVPRGQDLHVSLYVRHGTHPFLEFTTTVP